MEKLLRVTNALLAIIALCLVLIVAKGFYPRLGHTAYAQAGNPQPVYLVYSDELGNTRTLVGKDGRVPVKPGR